MHFWFFSAIRNTEPWSVHAIKLNLPVTSFNREKKTEKKTDFGSKKHEVKWKKKIGSCSFNISNEASALPFYLRWVKLRITSFIESFVIDFFSALSKTELDN